MDPGSRRNDDTNFTHGEPTHSGKGFKAAAAAVAL